MNIHKLISASLFVLLLLLGCAGKQAQLASPPIQFLSRQVIVTLSEDHRDKWESIDREIQTRYGIAKAGEFSLTSIHVNCLVYRVPEHLSVEQIILELTEDKRVQMVERNQFFNSLTKGNGDPLADMDYGMKLIGADQVYQVSTGKNVAIAIIDTGINSNHPDLAGQIIDTQNFVEGGDPSFKTDAHGTAVAGIIGAGANDGMGIRGVAPDARIMALKACWHSDSHSQKARCASWTLAKALDYAINHGVRIINMSLTGPPDKLLTKLLAKAYSKGIILVAAANESQAEPGFPASVESVIPVISSDSTGTVARPSWSFQAAPLAAPGIDILTTTPLGYDFYSGSSLATAHVSGVIALLLQLRPQLSVDEIRDVLKTSATYRKSSSIGIVNACEALSILETMPYSVCADGLPDNRMEAHEQAGQLITTMDYPTSAASASTNDFHSGITHGFFSKLGGNGRSCNTCHLPEEAWTFTPAHAQQLAISHPSDPLFAPVDGSDCPPTSSSQSPDARLSGHLVNHGLIRVQLGIPETADFALASASNPQNCQIPAGNVGISKQLFLFRRPLPPTNLIFRSTLMWDGRKSLQPIATGQNFANTTVLVSGLLSQSNDGVIKHAQGDRPITGTQAHADILAFELNMYSAQRSLNGLNLEESNGGPRFIAEQLAPKYFTGQNDSLSGDYDKEVFNLFKRWEPGNSDKELTPLQKSIGRGEHIFNTRLFLIANVPGLNSTANHPLYNTNDPFPNKTITGTCGTCHNTPNIGNHSSALPLNIGVSMAANIHSNDGATIDVPSAPELPVYTLRSQSGVEVQVTDPGRALITGKWIDIGKFNSPVLRGLNGRAPYFHNGSAKDLTGVVQFYNARFDIGLTKTEVNDLVAFLMAL
ncbi:MAG: S8 family serine peptidase [Methylococcales bacterium]|nr:S8 family serine peptidase [Methylococcaceae bacterium]